MNYAQARAWLSQLLPLGVNLGTERVAEVLLRLHHPEQHFTALHIAGTNGKGSTAAFATHLLLAAARAARREGLRPPALGLYTSPHLLRLTERVRLSHADFSGLTECTEDELAQALSRVRAAQETSPAVALTFFEAITVAAFLIFAERGVRVAVVEVGLGGRLDATRLCRPFVSVVTSIGLDHTEILGPALTDIAREKAGIFHPGVPVVLACDDPTAQKVLHAEARRAGAAVLAQWSPAEALPPDLAAAISLEGAHQRRNAWLALRAAHLFPPPFGEYLQRREIQIEGLATTRWPGRLERLLRLHTGTEVWIDAAHNPEGAEALSAWLEGARSQRPLTVLFGVVTGKQAEGMLAPLRRADHVVLTRPPSPRGRPPEELLPLVQGQKVHVAAEVAAALEQALSLTPPGGLLLCYGSLFLLAEVRRIVLGEAGDKDPLQDPVRARSA